MASEMKHKKVYYTYSTQFDEAHAVVVLVDIYVFIMYVEKAAIRPLVPKK